MDVWLKVSDKLYNYACNNLYSYTLAMMNRRMISYVAS